MAALEGRITTTPLKPGAAEINAFLESRKVLPEAQAPRRPYADDNHKPDFHRSYALHVLPSQIEGTGNYGGMDFWSLQGFDVKGVISILYNLDRICIELPASFRRRRALRLFHDSAGARRLGANERALPAGTSGSLSPYCCARGSFDGCTW